MVIHKHINPSISEAQKFFIKEKKKKKIQAVRGNLSLGFENCSCSNREIGRRELTPILAHV